MHSICFTVCVFCLVPLTLFSQDDNKSLQTIKWDSLSFESASGEPVPYDYGFIQVRENRLKADSRLIELAVLRLRRKSKGQAYDTIQRSPVLFLSGGPGESGISYINEEYFQKLIFKLQEQGDVILLDQRGTGRSKPSLGYPLPVADNSGIFLSSQRAIALTAEAASAGEAAYRKNGTDIQGYNTIQSAGDINDLKTALGVNKLSILGVSYGTHLAIATAKYYPGIVDKMALIGVSGLNHIHHLPNNYDLQLKKISEMAAADSAINKEVPDMIELLGSILRKLEAKPIEIKIKDFRSRKMISLPIGKFGLQMILRLDAADSHDFIYFPAMLYGIKHGDYRLLQQYAERRFNQFNGAVGSGIFAIRQASGASPGRYDLIKEQGKTALLGNSMNTPDIYSGWKNVDLGDEYRAAFKCTIPTLFISGTLDCNTPVSNVTELIGDFSNSTHLVVENAGHEDMLPAETVQKQLINFFSSGAIKVTNVSLPKPRFVKVF